MATSVTSHAHPDTLNNLENCWKEKERILKQANENRPVN